MSERNASTADVVIVGGGIVGAAAAAFLAEAGASVLLIERDGLASAASGANSGAIQHPFDPVLAALYRETLGHDRRLAEADVGFAMGATPAGLLYVSRDERAVREADRALALSFPDLRRDVVTGTDLMRLDPAVSPDLWACRVDIGFPVQPAASTYGFATLAERAGVHIRVGRPAVLVYDGDRLTGVVVNGVPIGSAAVLVAAGPWTPEVIDPSGDWRPIQPRWGVVVETLLPDGPRHVLEEAEIGEAIGTDQPVPESTVGRVDDQQASETRVDFSFVPLDGVASVGSTFLIHEPTPAQWVEPILAHAARFVPAVADAPIRGTRSCPRPQSLDGRPLIGAVPGRAGLFVCAGHGPWGISTGPASARLVADAMLGRSPAIPAALDPARFGPVPPPAGSARRGHGERHRQG
jgi:glycine/D-amino acid oxidase-like deaminating enzyme